MTNPARNQMAGKTKFIQANVNRSRASHDMLFDVSRRLGADVLIVSEQNTSFNKNPDWLVDDTGSAAIFTGKLQAEKSGRGRGFVHAEINGFLVISCYVLLP